jgi:hypothetical protein
MNAFAMVIRPRRSIFAAAVVAALAAAALTGYALHRPKPHDHVAAAPPSVPRPVHSAPASASAPAAAPVPKPRKQPAPREYVAPAVPTSFELAGRGFTIRAHVCAMSPVFPLDPPGEQHHRVCWVTRGFGERPGSNTATSYILGHSWAEDSQEVLNKASTRATRDILNERARRLEGVPIYPAKSLVGARIVLRTPAGTLGYRVRQAYGVDKLKLGSIRQVMNPKIRNRILLITCAERHGVDYDYDIVLDARLVSSKAAASRA